ncbi:MAG: inositol monophosphatase [Deltaproteobacteria bacterium]|nr:inositol monophosphatase [Deltaproteobacteria bacterium]
MNQETLRGLLDLARDAAWAGAAVLERHARHVTGRRVDFANKGGSPIDLVTEVDHESERAIVAVLRRAGIPIVAEESGAEESGAEESGAEDARSDADASLTPGAPGDAVFYVDPLDGTTNYAHGHPFHSVSIGLVLEGEPVLGVVHAPMLGALWTGARDLGGSRRDLFRGIEQPLAVSTVDSLDASLGATGFPYDRRTSADDNLAAFGALTKSTHGVLRCGSAALDLALVADGTYDLYWERKLKPWDLAAGAALVAVAGGRVSDPWGARFSSASGAIAASNGRVHDALLSAIARHQPEAPR